MRSTSRSRSRQPTMLTKRTNIPLRLVLRTQTALLVRAARPPATAPTLNHTVQKEIRSSPSPHPQRPIFPFPRSHKSGRVRNTNTERKEMEIDGRNRMETTPQSGSACPDGGFSSAHPSHLLPIIPHPTKNDIHRRCATTATTPSPLWNCIKSYSKNMPAQISASKLCSNDPSHQLQQLQKPPAPTTVQAPHPLIAFIADNPIHFQKPPSISYLQITIIGDTPSPIIQNYPAPSSKKKTTKMRKNLPLSPGAPSHLSTSPPLTSPNNVLRQYPLVRSRHGFFPSTCKLSRLSADLTK